MSGKKSKRQTAMPADEAVAFLPEPGPLQENTQTFLMAIEQNGAVSGQSAFNQSGTSTLVFLPVLSVFSCSH